VVTIVFNSMLPFVVILVVMLAVMFVYVWLCLLLLHYCCHAL
jgi:hypothetical protein